MSCRESEIQEQDYLKCAHSFFIPEKALLFGAGGNVGYWYDQEDTSLNTMDDLEFIAKGNKRKRKGASHISRQKSSHGPLSDRKNLALCLESED